MNFGLDETQKAFETLARDFLDRECSPQVVRQAEEAEAGFSPQLYQKLADQGLLGLNIDEEFGGSAVGYTEIVLFCQQAGSHLLPGPYVPLLTAAEIIRRHGTADQKQRILPSIAQGEAMPLPAWLEGSNDCRFEQSSLQSRATRQGDVYHLQGCKKFVPFGSSATHFLWLAASGEEGGVSDQTTLFLFPAEEGSAQVTDFETQGGARVSDVSVEAECPADGVVGAVDQGWSVLCLGLELGRVATAAYALGAAEKALEMGVQYAIERHQFGRPIGSFQAIQHKLATCRCLVEQSKWLTFHAAGLMDGGNPATGEASMAKLAACRALRETATASSLVHGGYGFMQEYDIQLYFRRAKDVENWCGSLLIDRDLILRSALDPVDQAR